jgi:membrane-associated phospholipid phosphatase
MKTNAALLALCALAVVSGGRAFARESKWDKYVLGNRNVYEYKLTDFALGLAAAGLGLIAEESGKTHTVTRPDAFNLAADVNAFDRWSALAYNPGFDVASDVFQWAAVAAPALLFFAPSEDWLTIGVMYIESVALSYAAKEAAKAGVTRYRPYNYFSGARPPDDSDFGASFFSGHTTMAFNGAAFVSTVFSAYYKDSPWKYPVIGISFSIAAATGAFRIASGSHFFSDVLLGALVGTATGFLTPFLHRVSGGGGTPAQPRVRGEGDVSPFLVPGGGAAVCWL